ncbi:MAG: YabP/YqfC family sporulation protein [Oscillospiraceae bacterium]|nr:YabP/YqfC family sporulation protein [Oscillospiraceae bacterium]
MAGKKNSGRLAQAFEENITGNTARIEFSGNREVIVEGCKGILEYDDTTIRLNLGRESVRFLGKGLSIGAMSGKIAVIEGYINSMEFLR